MKRTRNLRAVSPINESVPYMYKLPPPPPHSCISFSSSIDTLIYVCHSVFADLRLTSAKKSVPKYTPSRKRLVNENYTNVIVPNTVMHFFIHASIALLCS